MFVISFLAKEEIASRCCSLTAWKMRLSGRIKAKSDNNQDFKKINKSGKKVGRKSHICLLKSKKEYWFIYDTRQAHPPAA